MSKKYRCANCSLVVETAYDWFPEGNMRHRDEGYYMNHRFQRCYLRHRCGDRWRFLCVFERSVDGVTKVGVDEDGQILPLKHRPNRPNRPVYCLERSERYGSL